MSESTASVFRTAVAPAPTDVSTPSEPGDPSGTIATSESDLFYTYEDAQQRPFTADYFDITDIWDKEPVLKSELQTIEKYLRQQVVQKKIDNKTSAIKEYLKHLESKAKVEPYESTTIKITKILKYLDFLKVLEN